MIKTIPSLKLLLCAVGIMLIIVIFVKYLHAQQIFFNSGLLVMVLIITGLVISIKKLYRSISMERNQLNALLRFNPLGTVITDCYGKVIFMNPAAVGLFDYTAEEVLGRSVNMLLPQRVHAAYKKHLLSFLSASSDAENGYNLDVFAMKKNGIEFPVRIKLNAYYKEKECYAVTFINDVTDTIKSEENLIHQKEQLEKVTRDVRRMNTELENKVAERTLILREALLELEKSQTELSETLNKEKELNEIKSRFVSMASHEFRTPLSAILSSASLLSKYHFTEDQVKRDKHIRRIKGSVEHLNDILEDFLNLGKLEEGRVFVNAEMFDVKEFMMEVFDDVRHILKHGQQMHLTYNGQTAFITDNRLLKNIMFNLLSNAIKFSDEKKMIEVSVENSGSRIGIQVKDQGIGIPIEDMPYLFSTFYRAKNAVNIQGTGLGLHIVKRYINKLEGDITLSSELNKGCTFSIKLPSLFETS